MGRGTEPVERRPGIAIKKDTVPSETGNDAVNEAPGEVDDSISIVAPELTNGPGLSPSMRRRPMRPALSAGHPKFRTSATGIWSPTICRSARDGGTTACRTSPRR